MMTESTDGHGTGRAVPCHICDDDKADLYACASCRISACGCCIGACECCDALVCAECAVASEAFDPLCPRCAAPEGHPLKKPGRFLTPPDRDPGDFVNAPA